MCKSCVTYLLTDSWKIPQQFPGQIRYQVPYLKFHNNSLGCSIKSSIEFDPISADIRDRLHWLPIRSRIDFKLGLLVHKCLHGIAPAYLREMLVLKSTVPALSRLCSTTRSDLLVPKTKTKTIVPRSFATSGPALWNKLPDNLRDPSLSLPVFKQRLKSYLFKQCWFAI